MHQRPLVAARLALDGASAPLALAGSSIRCQTPLKMMAVIPLALGRWKRIPLAPVSVSEPGEQASSKKAQPYQRDRLSQARVGVEVMLAHVISFPTARVGRRDKLAYGNHRA